MIIITLMHVFAGDAWNHVVAKSEVDEISFTTNSQYLTGGCGLR